jgi:hypothetical protein
MYLVDHKPSYLTDIGAACACHSDMGMVSPANIATLGAMELGRTVASYNRAISKLIAKIRVLKAKKRKARLKARKRVLQSRITIAERKLGKLRAYRKVRVKNVANKIGVTSIATDEDIILQEALAPASADPMTADIDLDFSEQQLIEEGAGEMDFGKIALYAGLAGVAILLGAKFMPKKKRKNRKVIGKKKSNPKRKTKRKSVRRKRK